MQHDLVLPPAAGKLAYYPHKVWLYLPAAQWARIGQEEAFLGRTGEAGDDLGTRVIAARLVREVIGWRSCSNARMPRTASGSAPHSRA